MQLDERYYAKPLTAFVRTHLQQPNLSQAEAFNAAKEAELRIAKFKRKMALPRVTRILGILRSFAPADLLDIGSGRGTFLWPLLDHFPYLHVSLVEDSPQRFQDFLAVQQGGVARLHPYQMDVTQLTFQDNSFDGITFLEVLEHVKNPQAAANEAVRVARRFILLSVPSKPDDNPEHIHFFQPDDLKRIFLQAGAQKVQIDHVLNHRIAIIKP